MKKHILSFSLIMAFAFYVALTNPSVTYVNPPSAENGKNNAGQVTVDPGVSSGGSGDGGGGVAQATVPAKSRPPRKAVPPPAAGKTYNDGVYVGNLTDAFYGNVQVQATVQGGRIVSVDFLSYPSDRGQSIAINSEAMPLLSSEAISSQSSNVDIVSGATDTSQAFMESLRSALLQAKA